MKRKNIFSYLQTIFKTKNRYKGEIHKLKFHIDGVHVLKENDTPDAHHDFTLAAHMKNLLLEKDSVETIELLSLVHPIEPDE